MIVSASESSIRLSSSTIDDLSSMNYLLGMLPRRSRHSSAPCKQEELSDMVLTTFLIRVKAKSDTPGRFVTAHSSRSSFRDWCSEQGHTRDLAERSLAHSVQNKIEAAYHRTDLLEQRKPLLEAWSR